MAKQAAIEQDGTIIGSIVECDVPCGTGKRTRNNCPYLGKDAHALTSAFFRETG